MTDQTPLPDAADQTDAERPAPTMAVPEIADLNVILSEMRGALREVAVSARVMALGPERIAPVFFRDSVIRTHVPYVDFDDGQRKLAMTARHDDELGFFQLAEHDIVPAGRSLVVVGGYLGCSTVALARVVSPGPVHVFEPQECLQAPLRTTLDLNGLAAAQVHRRVVTEDGAAMALGTQRPTRLAETVFVARAGGGYPATSLDAMDLGDVGLLHLCFNGSKIPALRGAVETIKRCSPVILCDKSGRDLAEIATFLGDLGYADQAVGPRLYLYVRAPE
jgi:hypothetical protein